MGFADSPRANCQGAFAGAGLFGYQYALQMQLKLVVVRTLVALEFGHTHQVCIVTHLLVTHCRCNHSRRHLSLRDLVV